MSMIAFKCWETKKLRSIKAFSHVLQTYPISHRNLYEITMKCANLDFKKRKFKFLITTVIKFVLLIKNLKEGITLRTGLMQYQ